MLGRMWIVGARVAVETKGVVTGINVVVVGHHSQSNFDMDGILTYLCVRLESRAAITHKNSTIRIITTIA
jgi:hypothetical protein